MGEKLEVVEKVESNEAPDSRDDPEPQLLDQFSAADREHGLPPCNTGDVETDEKSVIPVYEKKASSGIDYPSVAENYHEGQVDKADACDHNEKNRKGSIDRDDVLARVETDKRLALIKAWEESEKTKADNKAYKNMCAVESWEKSKRAIVEAQLKKIEEKWEKKKGEYAEKMKNRMAEIHLEAEKKRAMVEAKRCEDFLKVEETAAKYHVSGHAPPRSLLLGCFTSWDPLAKYDQ